jgi:hypothetical protein
VRLIEYMSKKIRVGKWSVYGDFPIIRHSNQPYYFEWSNDQTPILSTTLVSEIRSMFSIGRVIKCSILDVFHISVNTK